MNSETPSPQLPRIPRQRRRGILLAALVILASLAIVTLTTLAYRPQWRPLTGTHAPKDAALVMDCPENWIVTELPGMTNKSVSQAFSSALTLKMRPLTGLPAWWQKHILRQENAANDNSLIVAYAMRTSTSMMSSVLSPKAASASPLNAKPRARAEAEKMLDVIERGARRQTPPVTTRRMDHSLGSALELDVEMSAPANGLPNTSAFTGKWHVHALYIVPLRAPPDNGPVIVSCNLPSQQYAFMRPTLERMFRSMRFVRK